MSSSGASYHWGILLGAHHKTLIAAKSGLVGFNVTNCHKPLYVALGRLAKLVSYTFFFFFPYWLYDAGGLGETVVCFWYMFWWQVIDCLLDSGVTTKETLLSFTNFVCDPERAVGPAWTRSRQGLPLVVNGVSGWVRSQMEEGGAGGTSDIVKVMRVDPVSPV